MSKEVKIPDGTAEERAMYLKLAKKFGLKIAKTIEPIPGKVKIIRTETYCSLCECTRVQFIKMLKYTDGIWKYEDSVTKEEAKEINNRSIHKDSVSCCEMCIDFLMRKDKIELVKIIMRSKSPILINKAVKRVLKDMREEKEDE